MKSGNLNFLEPSGPLQACNGTALPLPETQNLSSSVMSAKGKTFSVLVHECVWKLEHLREVWIYGLEIKIPTPVMKPFLTDP